MQMKLYMVRHGQSQTNLEQKYTGWAQVELTEKGHKDAEKAGQFLQGIPFDRIYASDLSRAVHTAKIALPGCEPLQTPLLREIGLGVLEKRSISECTETYGEVLARHRLAYDYTAYGGENGAMIRQRVRDFLTLLEKDPAENIAAFAHAGTLMSAMDVIFEAPLDRKHLRCPNGCIAIFVYENDRWALQTWGAGLR